MVFPSVTRAKFIVSSKAFGLTLATSEGVSCPTETGGTRGAVVNKLLEFSEMRYAVIEAPQIESGPERFVVAYYTEQSLREFIAAPRIIAIGFSSRAEAVARSEASPAGGAPKRPRQESQEPNSFCCAVTNRTSVSAASVW